MTSIEDRLKALGVKTGREMDTASPKPAPKRGAGIDQQLKRLLAHVPLQEWPTLQGPALVHEQVYPADYRLGKAPLAWTAPLEMMAAWAGEPGIAGLDPEQFAFLDTETSGLGGGTGTYTFLIGIGRFEAGRFRLAQFFLPDPAEEPAQLAAVEAFLAPCKALVTFNGKAFDVPLMNTRYTLLSWPSPVKNLIQVDLLHLARRLWKLRLPSRRLGDLEQAILKSERTQQDVPGWLVPEIYFDYIHGGDPSPLAGVFYHNAQDILSLSALLGQTAELLENPLLAAEAELDMVAVAMLKEDLGRTQEAAELYLHLLGTPLPDPAWKQVVERLAGLYKRNRQFEEACRLWTISAQTGNIPAHVELAKACEHHLNDLPSALQWTESALTRILSPGYPVLERLQWQKDLSHRRDRLLQKLKPGSD